MIVNPSGPHCGCGNRGCAEAYAAGPAILAEANRLIVMGETTSMRAMIDDDLNKMTPEIVERAASEGDEIARQVLDYAGFDMGLAVANAISALAPNVVVLGGGVLKPHGIFGSRSRNGACPLSCDRNRQDRIPPGQAELRGRSRWRCPLGQDSLRAERGGLVDP